MRVNPRFDSLVWGMVLALFAAGLCWAGRAEAAGGATSGNPDFTQGGQVPEDAKHFWNLGATGAKGWMSSERLTTIDARQIAITKVDPGSPADGLLRVGDVILGVDGEVFSSDARTGFGQALSEAEATGRLALTRWRAGQTQTVVVELPALGGYSATAPYDCAKSKRILEQGCAWLAQQMADPGYKRNPYEMSLNAMALLASGEADYLPLVKKQAELAAAMTPSGYKSWWYGPILIFLSEYVMATGDRSVMSGLERLAMEAVQGQSEVGSWGHRFALPTGRLMGYGMMNAPGVPMTIGLVLAREAGVRGPELDLAIERSAGLLRFYVGKGSVPYGDHHPWIQTHDDNGKNGMAAVLFNLLSDQEAAEYFSRMSVATHGNERDTGHTGNFFNITWAMPGINLSGPNATGAWMAEYGGWYYDLARTSEGRFVHLGPPSLRTDKYARWDCTGAYMLAYAMPLKKLRLTGRGKTVVPQISMPEAEQLVDDGRGWNNKDRNRYYDGLTTLQLLERLRSWSPVVRDRAAHALKRRKAQVLPQLLVMLTEGDRDARCGACLALKQMRSGAADAVPALIKALDADDLWLRTLAAEALQSIGGPAKAALPKLLESAARKPTPDDPRGMEQRYLVGVLFSRNGLLNGSLEGVDRKQFYAAVKAGLTNQDGRARSTISGTLYNRLTLDEIRPLLPAIHRAVIEPSPSGVMFASGVRFSGVQLLAKHRVAQGLDAGVYLLEHRNGWGTRKHVPKLMEAIVSYGSHAKRVVPDLQRIAAALEAEDNKRRERARQQPHKPILGAIEKINAATDKPELIHIEPSDGERLSGR